MKINDTPSKPTTLHKISFGEPFKFSKQDTDVYMKIYCKQEGFSPDGFVIVHLCSGELILDMDDSTVFLCEYEFNLH